MHATQISLESPDSCMKIDNFAQMSLKTPRRPIWRCMGIKFARFSNYLGSIQRITWFQKSLQKYK